MSVSIMEMAQMMRDGEAVQKDVEEAAGLVRGFFQEKYMTGLRQAVEERHRETMQDPPREVRLLQAMLRFMPEQNQGRAEKIIETMGLIGTTKSILAEMAEMSDTAGPAPETAPARPQGGAQEPPGEEGLSDEASRYIHDDGIYDVDYACLNHKQNTSALAQQNALALLFLLNRPNMK